MSAEREVWMDVPGYEGLYMASNQGRVRALAKRLKTNIPNQPNGRFSPMQDVNPIIQHSGYANIGLWRDQKCKQVRLHRLIAELFCDNDDPERKKQVNHINENKLDNRASNLEWVTAKQNSNHGTRNKRLSVRRSGSVRTPVECLLAGNVFKRFNSIADANEWLGVDRQNRGISDVCRGIQYTAFGYEWRYAAKGGDTDGNELWKDQI